MVIQKKYVVKTFYKEQLFYFADLILGENTFPNMVMTVHFEGPRFICYLTRCVFYFLATRWQNNRLNKSIIALPNSAWH